jgi:hypothetical protein
MTSGSVDARESWARASRGARRKPPRPGVVNVGIDRAHLGLDLVPQLVQLLQVLLRRRGVLHQSRDVAVRGLARLLGRLDVLLELRDFDARLVDLLLERLLRLDVAGCLGLGGLELLLHGVPQLLQFLRVLREGEREPALAAVEAPAHAAHLLPRLAELRV